MAAVDDLRRAMARVVAALPSGGEERPGQLRMAEAVGEAIGSDGRLVVQAGTGTGKTLGYLVPAVLSGRRTVVATATKALQDQLAGKDLPFLQAHLGVPFEFAVLKGRSNYLCRQRAREIAGGDDQLALEDVAEDAGAFGAEVLRLVQWGRISPTGDRSELDFEPRPRAWRAVSVSATECPGAARCPAGEECFAEAARRRAEEADVAVVNMHLYGAHLGSGGHVLPEHDVVVFDEAHELEDVLAASLGIEISAGRFRALARAARSVVDTVSVLEDLETAAARLEAALDPWRGRRLPAGLSDAVAAAVDAAGERAGRVLQALRASEGDAARKARAMQSAGHLAGDLQAVRHARDGWVTWVEGPPASAVLKVAPVDVGPHLEDLWAEHAAVLTSATVPAGLAERLGLPDDGSAELDVGSPFPYATNALLYCATSLPDPRSAGYEQAMHAELEALILAAGGRTLALFTSWRAMEAAAAALAPRLPYRLLTQADLPKPALTAAFAADEHSCLFATMGFWQGIDVPGPALSLVAIDRIPFPRPGEPLLEARRERAGPRAFRTIDLPRAATLLAQGAGRLIRSSTDRGVVAVLDPRLARAAYRWDLVRALPPMRRTRHRHEVEAFLAGAPAP